MREDITWAAQWADFKKRTASPNRNKSVRNKRQFQDTRCQEYVIIMKGYWWKYSEETINGLEETREFL